MTEPPSPPTYDQSTQSAGRHKSDIEAHFKKSLLRPLTKDESVFLNQLNLFIVAFTNRCGSTFLTSLMHQAGLPVPPRAEVFNSDMVIDTSKEHDIPSFTDYFMKLTRGWAAENLVGFKASGQQLAWLAQTGLLSHLRSLRVVHCRRRDLVGQAISFHIATETGQWQSLMQARCRPEDVKYDGKAIEALRQTILRGATEIELFISHYHLESLEVYYEDCLADSAASLQRLGEFLGCSERLDVDVGGKTIDISQQRGPVNHAMRERFVAEYPEAALAQ